ncbi:hypothetical protein E2C01_014306 [Portunus trituberculatus]|uniref:Uncharacterized protein n=1 Tax=Portunus trituberculatus TaxID=210409 RepID=A0A5B7DIF5_PORTR|nr:hypothetical protein [Portunus trituberculatus]
MMVVVVVWLCGEANVRRMEAVNEFLERRGSPCPEPLESPSREGPASTEGVKGSQDRRADWAPEDCVCP